MKVCTRLPCLDDNFQYGSVEKGCFLSEALTMEDARVHSPLAECIMLATICGRAMSHKSLSAVESLYGGPPEDFEMRHDWLDSMATRRLQILQTNYPLSSASPDPIILWAHMSAHLTTIYLYQIMTTLSPKSSSSRGNQRQEREIWAAQEISRLATEHDYTHFKAHTFIPLPIFVAAARMKMYLRNKDAEERAVTTEAVEASLQAAIEALGKLRKVNDLAGHYLKILESTSEFTVSMK
jgi:hypothetical protein